MGKMCWSEAGGSAHCLFNDSRNCLSPHLSLLLLLLFPFPHSLPALIQSQKSDNPFSVPSEINNKKATPASLSLELVPCLMLLLPIPCAQCMTKNNNNHFPISLSFLLLSPLPGPSCVVFRLEKEPTIACKNCVGPSKSLHKVNRVTQKQYNKVMKCAQTHTLSSQAADSFLSQWPKSRENARVVGMGDSSEHKSAKIVHFCNSIRFKFPPQPALSLDS